MNVKSLPRPVSRCLREAYYAQSCRAHTRRNLTSTTCRCDEASVSTIKSPYYPPSPIPLDRNSATSPREERKLTREQHVHPIGSRRRRAAILSSDNVPFEQMPYQCFQEARKVLAADREEKLAQIAEMRQRIAKWQAVPAEAQSGEAAKKGRLVAMQKHLEDLKILADINDPMIKKRFEDGMGDMNRPIYRYLADRKWRSYDRKLLMQRIEQHHLVPDILPHLNPTASVSMGFGRRNIQPGQFVDALTSEVPLHLNIQVYDKGPRLVTIAVVDPDVPDLEKDGYRPRCHYLAVNIPISPSSTLMPLRNLKAELHEVQSWLPPFAQKGSPYHRLAVFVLQQTGEGEGAVDLGHFRMWQTKRDGWTLKQLLNHHQSLKPIGVNLFRTKWDEGTDAVMERAGVEGREVELVRKKAEKNVYRKKDGARYR